MPTYYDLTLGAISFVTLNNTVLETFGNVLTNVGSGTVPEEREPYKYEQLSVPVYGHYEEVDPYTIGALLRTETRVMFRNRQLCSDGFYMDFAKDPELSAWIAVGNCSLEYLEGGVSLAQFQLNLGQVYLIGTPSTSTDGVFVNAADLGLATTPNDFLRSDYTPLTQGSFSLGGEGAPRVNLGVNVGDIRGKTNGQALDIDTYSGLNGTGYFVDGLVHGNTVAWDYADSDDRRADNVYVADRRGFTSPTYTLAGDRDTHLYGWARAFGPEFPFTAGDVPAIYNDRVRMLYTGSSNFQIQTSTGSAFANNGTLSLGFGSISSVSLVEWRPYRAAVRVNFVGGPGKGAVFITLQKGWAGPMVEVYAQNDAGTPVEASISYTGGSLTQHTNQSDRWQMIRLGAVTSEVTWKTVPQDIIVPR